MVVAQVTLEGVQVEGLKQEQSYPAADPITMLLGFILPAVSVTTILLFVVPIAEPTRGTHPLAVPVLRVATVPSPRSALVTETLPDSACPFTVVVFFT
jgi:hypothetical protein